MSPVRRRTLVRRVLTHWRLSERRALRTFGWSRTSCRYRPQSRSDEDLLTASTLRLAGIYGRYGYRRVHALLRGEGWHVSHGRVERIWKRLVCLPKNPSHPNLASRGQAREMRLKGAES